MKARRVVELASGPVLPLARYRVIDSDTSRGRAAVSGRGVAQAERIAAGSSRDGVDQPG